MKHKNDDEYSYLMLKQRSMIAIHTRFDNPTNYEATLKGLMLQECNESILESLKETNLQVDSHESFYHFKGQLYIKLMPPPPPPHMDMRFEGRTPPPVTIYRDVSRITKVEFLALIVTVNILLILFYVYIIKKLLPLAKLKNAIIELREGNLNVSLQTNGKDEIAQIAQEFNNSIGKIKVLKEARQLFLRNIMHELKTPIMKGNLISKKIEDENQKDRLSVIFKRLDFLLKEFAQVERLNSDEWEINKQPYLLIDVLDHSIDLLMMENADIEIVVEDNSIAIDIDFEMFSVCLKNLIDNALRYSDDTKATVYINKDEISIINNAKKLEGNYLKFDKPFNRPYENSEQGLGLGLYIVNSIVKKHRFSLKYSYQNSQNIFSIIF